MIPEYGNKKVYKEHVCDEQVSSHEYSVNPFQMFAIV